MALWDKLRTELIDIIEWVDASDDTLVWKFPRHDNEIKNGAKLTVRPGQAAVFVNEGQIADVFEPGMYTLSTENMPILSTLKGWKYGFDSPFKVDVYFVNTRQFTDQKWGTKNPIMLRDPEFGPVRLRAFGTYVFKVKEPGKFINEIVGSNPHFTTDQITDQLRNLTVTRFTDLLGESRIPVLDLAANYDELSKFVTDKIGPEFGEYGIELTKMLVENISLPPKVEEALDKRSSMGIVGDLNKYTQFQAAEAMEKAADNPGGGASEGMGMGMGFAMANQMMKGMNQQGQQQQGQQQGQSGGQQQGPPPVPGMQYYVAVNGEQTGPYAEAAINTMIQQGNLTRDMLVWKQGMQNWQAAGEVEELKNKFGNTPPPIPGS